MAELILHDDDAPSLSPLTDLRASFELRSGALLTAERLAERFGEPAAMCVPQRLADVLAERYAVPINQPPTGEAFLVVNGRMTHARFDPPAQINTQLRDGQGGCIAALLDADHLRALIEKGGGAVADLPGETYRGEGVLHRPWDLLIASRANLADDLAHSSRLPRQWLMADSGVHRIGDQPIHLGEQTRIDPLVVIDATAGPVTIDRNATIHAMSVLEGPAYIGPGSCIAPHSRIRANTVIGPTCKVGGEVSATVFQGYSNKTHYGFIGDSYIGQWVNLGAGTTTSNLKNTYGRIAFQSPDDPQPIQTGLTFLGSIVGDHVKTAIGTRLIGGTYLGIGSMIALSSFTPKTVPPFAFLTDSGAKRYQWEKFREVAQRIMERRDCPLTTAQVRCLAELHASTSVR